MTSPTEFHQSPIAEPVGVEGDVCGVPVNSVALDLPIRWNRFCYVCNEEKDFVASAECLEGFIGECTACGDQRIVLFSRRCS